MIRLKVILWRLFSACAVFVCNMIPHTLNAAKTTYTHTDGLFTYVCDEYCNASEAACPDDISDLESWYTDQSYVYSNILYPRTLKWEWWGEKCTSGLLSGCILDETTYSYDTEPDETAQCIFNGGEIQCKGECPENTKFTDGGPKVWAMKLSDQDPIPVASENLPWGGYTNGYSYMYCDVFPNPLYGGTSVKYTHKDTGNEYNTSGLAGTAQKSFNECKSNALDKPIGYSGECTIKITDNITTKIVYEVTPRVNPSAATRHHLRVSSPDQICARKYGTDGVDKTGYLQYVDDCLPKNPTYSDDYDTFVGNPGGGGGKFANARPRGFTTPNYGIKTMGRAS